MPALRLPCTFGQGDVLQRIVPSSRREIAACATAPTPSAASAADIGAMPQVWFPNDSEQTGPTAALLLEFVSLGGMASEARRGADFRWKVARRGGRVSIGLAIRNLEGALLATDSLWGQVDETTGTMTNLYATKIRWIRGSRVALFAMPVAGEGLVTAAFLRGAPAPGGGETDVRIALRQLYRACTAELDGSFQFVAASSHSYWRSPHILAAGYSTTGPVLMRMGHSGADLEEVAGSGGVRAAGAWNELGDELERLGAVRWRKAKTMALAVELVRDVMTRYIGDYERRQPTDRRLGGPIHIAVVTRDEICQLSFDTRRAA